uniref:Uncharacterized protein n=1 Tax=Steinernema glaseri TaxID=37863 RepID=A0A1I7YQT1_9BILA
MCTFCKEGRQGEDGIAKSHEASPLGASERDEFSKKQMFGLSHDIILLMRRVRSEATGCDPALTDTVHLMLDFHPMYDFSIVILYVAMPSSLFFVISAVPPLRT